MRKFMPMIGGLLTSDGEAYRYLSTSIELFIRPHELEHMLKTAGFQKTKRTPLLGGVAHIILACK
jgi:demethylmenaquinone methyltransferase/2-methoxy-6-polyprenyl-1,4-benzoquinol methylase